ncbi:HDOD domain-containing protein [Vibrio sp. NTOU-M3]|uniref:HDOD domain-containing protein n=1 Tax=Vibrio sp. NTOU-M3 TaxID=3234954 RepID=UPI00349FC8E6
MRILLVDDERMVLNGLKRALFSTGWKLHTAESGVEALQLLKENEIDLIISDMRMPGMDGSELLEKISKLYPSIIRASLSGYADPEITIKGGFFAHQAFMKPCDPAVIKTEVNRIADILNLFPDRIIQSAIGKITSLPITPKLFFKVKGMLNSPQASMHDVAEIISQDPAMCAKIIHISNNAIFRGQKEISNVSEAITRLGSQIVINIIAMLEVYSISLNESSEPLEELQSECLKVASLAMKMVDSEQKDVTFLAGILHRIGEYVRIMIVPELMKAYLHTSNKGKDKAHLEKHLFHTKSEQLGGYLLHFWGFPLPIIEAVLICNEPDELIKYPFGAATAVYIASKLIKNEEVDGNLVSFFQLEDKLEIWKKSIE